MLQKLLSHDTLSLSRWSVCLSDCCLVMGKTQLRKKQSRFFTCVSRFFSVEHNRNLQYLGDKLKMFEVSSSWEMILLWLQRWQFFIHKMWVWMSVSVNRLKCFSIHHFYIFSFVMLILEGISNYHTAYHYSRGTVFWRCFPW